MEVKSYIASKIDRYIGQVVCQLPRNERQEARERLENNIYAMLEATAGNRTPDSQDVREVLRELGTPDQTAAAYYILKNKRSKMKEEQRGSSFLSMETLNTVLRILTFVSFVLLAGGLLGLVMHKVSNVGILFTGCAMALAVQVIREFFLTGEDSHLYGR